MFFDWTCFHGCARRATESVVGSQVLWSVRCGGTQAVVVKQSAAAAVTVTTHVNRARRMANGCVCVHASRLQRVWPFRFLWFPHRVYISDLLPKILTVFRWIQFSYSKYSSSTTNLSSLRLSLSILSTNEWHVAGELASNVLLFVLYFWNGFVEQFVRRLSLNEMIQKNQFTQNYSFYFSVIFKFRFDSATTIPTSERQSRTGC